MCGAKLFEVPPSPGWALKQKRPGNERYMRRLCSFSSSRVLVAVLGMTAMVSGHSPLAASAPTRLFLPGQIAVFKGAGPFGLSVAIAQATVFAGSTNKVDVFAETRSSWKPDGMLEGSDALAHSGFGGALSASGPTLLVGAADQPGGGRVYVFTDKDGKWRQSSVLLPPRGSRGFGSSVAISGSTAVVSSEAGSSAGRVSIFHEASSGKWDRVGELTLSGSLPGFNFGISLAISNFTIVAGCGTRRATRFTSSRKKDSLGARLLLGAFPESSATKVPSRFRVNMPLSGRVHSDRSSVASSCSPTLGAPGESSNRSANPMGAGSRSWARRLPCQVIAPSSEPRATSSAPGWLTSSRGQRRVGHLSPRCAVSGLAAGDYFGVTAAMSGNTAVVGAFPGRELYLFRI